jgi:hypothetical protein
MLGVERRRLEEANAVRPDKQRLCFAVELWNGADWRPASTPGAPEAHQKTCRRAATPCQISSWSVVRTPSTLRATSRGNAGPPKRSGVPK